MIECCQSLMISASGEVGQKEKMGEYNVYDLEECPNSGKPVYKHHNDSNDQYIFALSGKWVVG